MKRRAFLGSAMLFVALLALILTAGSSTAQAQCPDYWVNLNYIVPVPHPGPISVTADFANFSPTTVYTKDGHYTHRQDPLWGPPIGATVNGVFVPLGAKVKIPDPNLPPGMCIEVEVRLDSNGCLEIKLQPQGC